MGRSGASSRAIWALALGILGLIMCGLLAPIAWWFGASELRDIRLGSAPEGGYGLALAGMILGIVGTVMLISGCFLGMFYLILGIFLGFLGMFA
ncbi:MAG: DUF4190 domain-containing protein [Armatimonadetes bacterium]|nr:DUF4190 domain-containing protein [Armatimonadota bacterium]